MLRILILESILSVHSMVCSRNSCKPTIIIMLNNAAAFNIHLPGSQAALDYYMKQQFLCWKIGFRD